jgi:quinone-modifying oxidoreductase subunit QmoC
MMIRAGMKEAVFQSNTLWNCTSCYRCTVRCPRGIPVTHIVQGLAAKAVDLGYASEVDTARFARSFWWSVEHFGRTDERLVTAKYYFSFGLKTGIQKSLENMKIALGMVLKGRMHLGLPHKVADKKGLRAILEKAAEIEARDQQGGTES